MMVSSAPCAPCAEFPRREESSSIFQWCLVGIFLATTVFLLFTSSDACVLPPPFVALELVDKPKPYYEVGERVTYRCKKGYDQLFGYLTVATCEQNHTWVPISDDACLKKACPQIGGPRNGRGEFSLSSREWGSHITFFCSNGYYVVGKKVVNCVLKGEKPEWDGTTPKCEKILCSPPPNIKDGKYTFSDIEVFEYMEAVTYSCNERPGKERLSLVGESELYCAANGVWSSKPPECKVVKCPYPEVEHGKMLSGFGKKYSYKTTVVFECIQGYYMNGSSTVVCTGDSIWDPPLPLCLKVAPPPSTKPPTLSYSGPKPTHPKKPSVHNYPGYPNPSGGLFDDEFGYYFDY